MLNEPFEQLTNSVTIPPNLYIKDSLGRVISLQDYFGRKVLLEQQYKAGVSPLSEIFKRAVPGKGGADANAKIVSSILGNMHKSVSMGMLDAQSYSPLKAATLVGQAMGPGIQVSGVKNIRHLVNPFIPEGTAYLYQANGIQRIISNTKDALLNTMDADGDTLDLIRAVQGMRDFLMFSKHPVHQTHVRRNLSHFEYDEVERKMFSNLVGYRINQGAQITAQGIIGHNPGTIKDVALGRGGNVETAFANVGRTLADPNLIGILKNKFTYQQLKEQAVILQKVGSGSALTPREQKIVNLAGLTRQNVHDPEALLNLSLAVRAAEGNMGHSSSQMAIEDVIKGKNKHDRPILRDTLRLQTVEKVLTMKNSPLASMNATEIANTVAFIAASGQKPIQEELQDYLLGIKQLEIRSDGAAYRPRNINKPLSPLQATAKSTLASLLAPVNEFNGKKFGTLELKPIEMSNQVLEELGMSGIPGFQHMAMYLRGAKGGAVPLGGSYFNDGANIETLILSPIIVNNQIVSPGSKEYEPYLERMLGDFSFSMKNHAGEHVRNWGEAQGPFSRGALQKSTSRRSSIATALGLSEREVDRIVAGSSEHELTSLIRQYDMATNPHLFEALAKRLQENASGFGVQASVNIRGSKGLLGTQQQRAILPRVNFWLGEHFPSESEMTSRMMAFNKQTLTKAGIIPSELNTEGSNLASYFYSGSVDTARGHAKNLRQSTNNLGLDDTMLILTDFKNLGERQYIHPLFQDEMLDAANEVAFASPASQDYIANALYNFRSVHGVLRDSDEGAGWEQISGLNAKTGNYETKYIDPNIDTLTKLVVGAHKGELTPAPDSFQMLENGHLAHEQFVTNNIAGNKEGWALHKAAAYTIEAKTGKSFHPWISKIETMQSKLSLLKQQKSPSYETYYAAVEAEIIKFTDALYEATPFTLKTLEQNKAFPVLAADEAGRRQAGLGLFGVEATSTELAAARALTDRDMITGMQTTQFTNQSILTLFDNVVGHDPGLQTIAEKVLAAKQAFKPSRVNDLVAQLQPAVVNATERGFQAGLQEAAAEAMQRLAPTEGSAEVWQAVKSIASLAAKNVL